MVEVNKYFDNETHIIATCYKADRYVKFFDAVFGPHGCAKKGQWVAMDASGFCVAFDEEDFNKRFTKIEMQQLAWTRIGDTKAGALVLGCGCPFPGGAGA